MSQGMLGNLECALATLKIGCEEQNCRKRRQQYSHPAVRPILDEPMPTEPDPPTPQQTNKPWLAACVLHTPTAPRTPTVALEVNGCPYPFYWIPVAW
ncbi:uncharacterized protein LOC108265107 [Tachysurus ichikawai]